MIVYLEITSFTGISFGAEHYYGKLKLYEPYTVVDIEAKLTSKKAKELSKKDGFTWRAGNPTDRFDSEEEIIEIAKAAYKKHFPQADMLVLGRSASRAPKLMLDGPEKLMKKCNRIFEEYEKIPWVETRGFYDRTPADRKKDEELSYKWEALLGE